MEKALIAAIADNNAIGRGNALLWRLPEDMKYFKSTTMGCPVIMGRMTYESLGGRVLPGRLNIVVTTRPIDVPEGVVVAAGLPEAYEAARKSGAVRLFVIGGGETYRRAMPEADALYITHVHDIVKDADTFFPIIDGDIWREDSRSDTRADAASGISYEFVVYKRR
ncbi:MAG: dihydrofolate reductase [Bacteroidales bacterium]|nr:dihydrofolate reductase [Bacteroidales bacterium]